MKFSSAEWRAMTPDERFAKAGAGYSADELPTALRIKRARDVWMASEQAAEVNDVIATWAKQIEKEFSDRGEDIRQYKYFHTLVGSTPPEANNYSVTPDTPDGLIARKLRELEERFGTTPATTTDPSQ